MYMKKTYYIIFYVLIFYSMGTMAQLTTESSYFRLDTDNSVVFNNDRLSLLHSDSLELNSNMAIEGLALSGLAIQSNHDSFIRVLLKDTEGTEYVVLETCRLYNDVDTLRLMDYCEETKYLPMVHPQKLYIYLKNSSVDSLGISVKYPDETTPSRLSERIAYQNEMSNLNKSYQSQFIANNINENNRKHKRLWRARATDLSKIPWKDRKKTLNIDGNCSPIGYEYYYSGIFEIGDPSLRNPVRDLPIPSYPDDFDWRNRHGINWMTSVKNQGTGKGDWAFAAVGVTEALVNLYFNRKIDLDLSEQEVISCSGCGSNASGGNVYNTLGWIATHGVSEEASFPFSNSDEPCSNMGNYDELIKINGVTLVPNHTTDFNNEVKKALIFHGPLLSGFRYDNGTYNEHFMTLVGYNMLQVGDTIRFFDDYYQNPDESVVIDEEYDEWLYHTYWIFKDSRGTNNEQDGYIYIFFNDQSCFLPPYYAQIPVSSLNYSVSDIAVTDSDGDGFYYWGIGPKPPHCPSWIPCDADGDDSDYETGPMDEYGNASLLTENLNVTYSITSNTIWSQINHLFFSYRIPSGVTLTINNDAYFCDGTKIIIDGGTLIIDGGHLYNASIEVSNSPGSTIKIINDGSIENTYGEPFEIPSGAILEINQGTIITQEE